VMLVDLRGVQEIETANNAVKGEWVCVCVCGDGRGRLMKRGSYWLSEWVFVFSRVFLSEWVRNDDDILLLTCVCVCVCVCRSGERGVGCDQLVHGHDRISWWQRCEDSFILSHGKTWRCVHVYLYVCVCVCECMYMLFCTVLYRLFNFVCNSIVMRC
jgi:hypothetical protein